MSRVVKLYGDPPARGHYLRSDRERTLCGDAQPWEDKGEGWGGGEKLVMCCLCLREAAATGGTA